MQIWHRNVLWIFQIIKASSIQISYVYSIGQAFWIIKFYYIVKYDYNLKELLSI